MHIKYKVVYLYCVSVSLCLFSQCGHIKIGTEMCTHIFSVVFEPKGNQ